MTFIKMVFFNIIKHPKRSLLIMFVVMVSVIAMVFIGGMFEGMRTRFYDNLLQESGHLQIHSETYKDRIDPASLLHTMEYPKQFTDYLLTLPGILKAEPVIHFGTKMIYRDKNLFIPGTGINPDTGYFGKVRTGIIDGDFLENDEDILISSRIAELLGCFQGEYVHLVVQRSDDSPDYQDYKVKGIFKTDSKDFDEYNIFITHSEAQNLLYLPEQTIEIRVNMSNPALTEQFKTEHQAWFLQRGTEIETWREIHGSFVILIEFFDIFMFFMNIFVLIVAATVITNTILMSVFERISEFGTLRAIGLKKHHIFFLVLGEGACQGITGGITGLMIAIPLLLLVAQTGIDMGEVSDSMKLGSTFPFALSAVNAAMAFLFGVLIAVAGSLYAAIVNIRMKLIDTFQES